MTTQAPNRPRRSSQRIISLERRTRAGRLVKNPPLIVVSDSDDDDFVYMSTMPSSTDLKKSIHESPSVKKERISSVPLVNVDELYPKNFVTSIQKSPLKKKSPFKDPTTPQKIYSKEQVVTPPKQRKIQNEENIAATPPSTPSVLLERLSLLSPEGKSNRKKLFEEEKDVYKNARRALHSTFPTDMPGREKEVTELKDFIFEHLNRRTSGTLYVSGPPGTGKTASLNLILQEEKVSSQLQDIYVNCTSIKSSSSIFAKISKHLGIKGHAKNEKDCIGTIENYFKKNQKPILLVLDEIDQLESKNQLVLYTIFEWPSIPNSKLILIGIANSLDLTDRILPRLQSRCELKPKLLHFAPYTKQQIVEIFTNRLKTAGVLDIFSPVALQMLAGKVAAISGDVRRALDIGRRVVELADRKRNGENVLQSVENFAEELDNAQNHEKKIKGVDLQQVVSILNNVYGTSHNLNDDTEDSFPLQQKIVVCSMLLILKKAKNKDVTIGRLHDVYRKVCSKRNIQVVDHGEFVGLCSLIETKGILKVIKKKDPRMSKISLMWDEEEVAGALKDKQLMSSILQDDGCLGRL